MKEERLTIESNSQVGKDTFLLKLTGMTSELEGSGQFAELRLDGYYLRRPLSIHDYSKDSITFLYKILGKGTKDLSLYRKGDTVDVLLPLGNRFDTDNSKHPLLIGGGIGIAPLYHLGKEFLEKGIQPEFLFGFRNREEIMMVDEFRKLGEVTITTDDGSIGYHGNPIGYLKDNQVRFDRYYACGPQVMLKFLSKAFPNGQVSLEARMGCGFGACMGCSIKTVNGYKRVCKEGPVFEAGEVIYE